MSMQSELADYIRKNREIYSRGAINQRLADEGYTTEEIDAAWNMVLQQNPRAEVSTGRGASTGTPATGTLPDTSRTGRLVALNVLIIIFGVILVLLTNIGLPLFTMYNSNPGRDTAVGVALAVVDIGSVAAIIGLLVAGGRFLRRGWTVGRVSALVTMLALLWYLVVLGTCLYGPSVLR